VRAGAAFPALSGCIVKVDSTLDPHLTKCVILRYSVYRSMDNNAIINYFGLNEHPFMTSPDPRFLYFSRQVKEALAKCEFMARGRIGPIYMYGPIGSGKTSLVRRLQEKQKAIAFGLLLSSPRAGQRTLAPLGLCSQSFPATPNSAHL
jgi:type II secretory pathway predicted ATPase ExeA